MRNLDAARCPDASSPGRTCCRSRRTPPQCPLRFPELRHLTMPFGVRTVGVRGGHCRSLRVPTQLQLQDHPIHRAGAVRQTRHILQSRAPDRVCGLRLAHALPCRSVQRRCRQRRHAREGDHHPIDQRTVGLVIAGHDMPARQQSTTLASAHVAGVDQNSGPDDLRALRETDCGSGLQHPRLPLVHRSIALPVRASSSRSRSRLRWPRPGSWRRTTSSPHRRSLRRARSRSRLVLRPHRSIRPTVGRFGRWSPVG
jgi:hypothetical protein